MRSMTLVFAFFGLYAQTLVEAQDPTQPPPPPAGSIQCHSCASPILRQNWEATGLAKYPSNSSFFSSDNCEDATTDNDHKCLSPSGICFFAAYTLITGEWVTVRSCLEDVLGGGIGATAELSCEVAKSDIAVRSKNFNGQPLIGWETCSGVVCNGRVLDLAAAEQTWNPSGRADGRRCEERKKIDCYECAHVDGSGSCKHNTKGRCTGNYCTKTAGKLASRWFEMRGCAPIDPLYAAACIDYDKSITIAHLGSTINQTYKATACTCRDSLCNGGGRPNAAALAAAALVVLFALMLVVVAPF